MTKKAIRVVKKNLSRGLDDVLANETNKPIKKRWNEIVSGNSRKRSLNKLRNKRNTPPEKSK